MLQGLQKLSPPDLYVLPKLQKMQTSDGPIVGRPIAACHSWFTTYVSKWLAKKLNAAESKYDTILTDRTKLIHELEGNTISKDAWLLVFDVEPLYPCVEHEGCAEAVDVPSNCCCPCRYRDMIRNFLRFVLKNYFVYVQGKCYQQIFGGAMGTNCMPPAAQLYLAVKW
jgi:hypothetical protein